MTLLNNVLIPRVMKRLLEREDPQMQVVTVSREVNFWRDGPDGGFSFIAWLTGPYNLYSITQYVSTCMRLL